MQPSGIGGRVGAVSGADVGSGVGEAGCVGTTGTTGSSGSVERVAVTGTKTERGGAWVVTEAERGISAGVSTTASGVVTDFSAAGCTLVVVVDVVVAVVVVVVVVAGDE